MLTERAQPLGEIVSGPFQPQARFEEMEMQTGVGHMIEGVEEFRHRVRHVSGGHNEAFGLAEVKLAARRTLAPGPPIGLHVLADNGCGSVSEISYGSDGQQIDSGQTLRQSFFLQGLRDPIGEFVIEARLFKVINKI